MNTKLQDSIEAIIDKYFLGELTAEEALLKILSLLKSGEEE